MKRARLGISLLFLSCAIAARGTAAPPDSSIQNPYFTTCKWRLWRLDESPVKDAKVAIPPATAPPTVIAPPDPTKRLWPVDPPPRGKIFELGGTPSKKLAGTWDDVYASWGNQNGVPHGWIRDVWKGPHGDEAKGIVGAMIAVADLSTGCEAHEQLGINFYHQSTTSMGHAITNENIPGRGELFEKIYFSSGLICSPCHLSLVESSAAHAEVGADLYMAYMPNIFNSVGSSDSETMAITKLVIVGAHMDPALKTELKRQGLYASTMLWLWKSCLPIEGAYDTEWRHRVAYAAVGDRFAFPGGYGAAGIDRGDMCLDFHQYDDTEHMRRMIEAARALKAPPPEAVVKLLEQKGGTVRYALKKTICVIQEKGQDIELRVSAEESYDVKKNPLALRWKLLYGNKHATVAREGESRVYTIKVPWDDALPEGRTSFILVANNGTHDGNPAAVNIYRKKGDLPPPGVSGPDYDFDAKFTNRRPIAVGLQNVLAKPGETLALPIRAIDPEGFPVTFTKRAGEPGTFDGNVLTWAIGKKEPPGDHTVTVIGSDGTSGDNYEARQIKIRIAPSLHAHITANAVFGKAPLALKLSAKGSIGAEALEWAVAPRAPGVPAMPKAEGQGVNFAKTLDKPGVYDAWLKATAGKETDVNRLSIYVIAGEPRSRPAKLAVEGNGVEIASGASAPSEFDHTDFGAAKLKASFEREFLIRNLGDAPMTLGKAAVTVAGENAAEFTVVQPREKIDGTGSARLLVKFAPKAAGARTATIQVKHGDATCSFAVKGEGRE